MKTMIMLLAIAGVSLAVSGAPAFGQIGAKPAADERVRSALGETDLKFSVDKDNDFRLLFKLPDDRTHLVFIFSKTLEWGNMEIREIFAFGYRSTTRLSEDDLEAMLKENARCKTGAWELQEKDGLYAAIFTVKVNADCGGQSLKTIMHGVAERADAMEKRLTGTDDL